jgi:hypothetical protein
LRRTASFALFAGLLAALAPGVADAESITFTTTPFSGTTTNYTTAADSGQSFVNADGSTITGSSSIDGTSNGNGYRFFNMNESSQLAYTNLPAGTTEVGFAYNTSLNSSVDYLASAEFVGAGFDYTFTGGSNYTFVADPYMGFISSSAFTSVTLTFTSPFNNADFVTSYTSGVAPSAVPEPGSLVNMALAAATGLGGLAYRRRRKRSA